MTPYPNPLVFPVSNSVLQIIWGIKELWTVAALDHHMAPCHKFPQLHDLMHLSWLREDTHHAYCRLDGDGDNFDLRTPPDSLR